MRTDSKGPNNGLQTILKYFSLLMALIYPAIGIYLFFSSPEQLAFPDTTKKIIGALLVLYGLFRFYRTYKRFSDTPQDLDKD